MLAPVKYAALIFDISRGKNAGIKKRLGGEAGNRLVG